jgi:hypothetical protein
MVNKLAIGIGVVVAVFVIVFCALPLKEVSYQGTEKYLAPVTYYVEEPYTTHSGAIPQPEVTQYKPVAEQTYVWKERPVTLYKKVSFLEALIGGY